MLFLCCVEYMCTLNKGRGDRKEIAGFLEVRQSVEELFFAATIFKLNTAHTEEDNDNDYNDYGLFVV